jgi:hypothetical protein
MDYFVDLDIDMKLKQPKVTTTWLSGRGVKHTSIIMVIPAEFTKDYHLDVPTNVLVTPTEEGLLIKKLEFVK